mmetsp:Transcript_4839/g.12251  ORF Transcript_4839/g.12251 Transcript_4839/m.12251 type:complete len:207 (+) Transcript_4839:2046-2666(+)
MWLGIELQGSQVRRWGTGSKYYVLVVRTCGLVNQPKSMPPPPWTAWFIEIRALDSRRLFQLETHEWMRARSTMQRRPSRRAQEPCTRDTSTGTLCPIASTTRKCYWPTTTSRYAIQSCADSAHRGSLARQADARKTRFRRWLCSRPIAVEARQLVLLEVCIVVQPRRPTSSPAPYRPVLRLPHPDFSFAPQSRTERHEHANVYPMR